MAATSKAGSATSAFGQSTTPVTAALNEDVLGVKVAVADDRRLLGPRPARPGHAIAGARPASEASLIRRSNWSR